MTIFGKLVYTKHGEPDNVLSFQTEHLEVKAADLQPGQVHVRVLASPINPVDMLFIRQPLFKGPLISPTKQPRTVVAGVEGVVEVLAAAKIGRDGEPMMFRAGDRAVVTCHEWGTWRQEGLIDYDHLVKVPNDLPREIAANLMVAPFTAFALMNYIAKKYLQPGDVFIHNAANSTVGQIVIQLAKTMGFKTISVIRNRPNLEETIKMLTDLGADLVVTNEQVSKGWESLDLSGLLTRPKLALECVGGHVSADLASTLANNGTMVVFGLLSGQPVQINQLDMMFRGIRVQSFLMKDWRDEHSEEGFRAAIEKLMDLFLDKKLKLPKIRSFNLSQWREAIEFASRGLKSEKAMLILDEEKQ